MSAKRLLLIGLAGIAVAIGVGMAFYIHLIRQENRQWELSMAAAKGDLTSVKRCVDAGAIIDAQPNQDGGVFKGFHALFLAAHNEREDVVRFLLEHDANPNLRGIENPLIAACWQKNYSIVTLLLEHGADPNARGDGETPLSVAESTGQPELIALLRQGGAHDDLNRNR